MDDKYLTREQSRAVDRIAIEQFGIPGMVLMENAGRGVVDVLLELDPSLTAKPEIAPIAILCGKGNNAGDGFVIARHLLLRGVKAKVLLLSPTEELSGDAKLNFEILRHCEVPIVDLASMADLNLALSHEADGAQWLIDAMLGTGAVGSPREPFETAIHWMNSQAAQRLAIDVPSGLDCDTGKPSEPTVIADHTCTFVAKKVGFAKLSATEVLGQMHVVSIGIPLQAVVAYREKG